MTDTGGELEFDSHLVGMWWELHSQFEATVTDPRETVIVTAGIGLTVLAIVSGMIAIVQTTTPWWAGTGLIILGVLLLVSVWRVAVSPRQARST